MRQILFILFFFQLFLSCYGQEAEPPRGKFFRAAQSADSIRAGSPNLQVDSSCHYKTKDSQEIRKILSQPIGWTNDFECLFTPWEITQLDSILRAFESETGNEIAVVTIDSAWSTDEGFDDLVLRLHNGWGVGKKNYNNGIVFGFSAGLRTMRISNGLGLEGILPDLETQKIINEVVIPEFRAKRYFEGTKKGVLAIIEKLR